MNPPPPFYFDWTFWAAALSLLAIILSQLPPVHLWLRPKRLEVEVHSRIRISHAIGNPNASVVVSVRNTGGRALRILSLRLDVSRDGKPVASLPGRAYYEAPSSESAVLFVPFTLKPGETWAHSVQFVASFDRRVEKAVREGQSSLARDIREKLDQRASDDKRAVVADAPLVEPFLRLFHAIFIWQPGEYVACLAVHAEPGSASFAKRYRFTLYESDSRDLVANTEDYKFGGGLAYDEPRHAGIDIPLAEHVS